VHLEAEEKRIVMRIGIVHEATGAPCGSTAQANARNLPEGITICRLQGDRVRPAALQITPAFPGSKRAEEKVAVTTHSRPLAGNVVLLEKSRYLRGLVLEMVLLSLHELKKMQTVLGLIEGARSKVEECPWMGR